MKTPFEKSEVTSSAARRSPLHLQISTMLAREIQSGMLIDGEKLVPERQMAADLKISVGTLRKALLDLEEKGLLNRIHGSGNYVNHAVRAENAYALFRLALISGAGDPRANLIDVQEVLKTNDLPSFGSSDSAFRFRRVRFLGDVQVALEEIFLDGSYATDISKADVLDSLYLFYKQQLGFWITRAEDRIGVAHSPDWAPLSWQTLNIDSCGFVQRQSRDQKGNVAEYSRTWFDPTTTQFVSRT